MAYDLDPAIPYKCRYVLYQDLQNEIDGFSDLKKKFGPGGAVEICTAKGHKDLFLIVSSINSEGGISYYSKRKIFRFKKESGYTWSYTAPDDSQYWKTNVKYMKRSDGGIVHYDDDDFIATEELSTKEFYTFSKNWDELKNSRSNYNKAIGIMQFLKELFLLNNSFKRSLYSNRPEDAIKLSYIGVIKRNINEALDLTVTASNRDKLWFLTVKLFNNQLRIESIYESKPPTY